MSTPVGSVRTDSTEHAGDPFLTAAYGARRFGALDGPPHARESTAVSGSAEARRLVLILQSLPEARVEDDAVTVHSAIGVSKTKESGWRRRIVMRVRQSLGA